MCETRMGQQVAQHHVSYMMRMMTYIATHLNVAIF
jgi:hypothetical protein